MKLLITGQSNAARIEENQSAIDELLTIFSDVSFSAFGGSALLEKNVSVSNPINYWVSATSLGGLYNGPRMLETLEALNTDIPDVIVWIQGEQDSTKITSLSEAQEFKSAQKYLFDQFLKYCDLVVTVTIGRRLSVGAQDGIHLTRIMTQQVASEMHGVEIMSDNYPLSLVDSVHYTSAAQVGLCQNLTDSIAQYLTNGTFDIGAKVTFAKGYARAVDVTFDNSLAGIGSDSYKLFSIRDKDGSFLQAPYSIDALSVIKVRLHFTNEPNGYICIGAGDLVGIDTSTSMQIICTNGKPVSPAMRHIA